MSNDGSGRILIVEDEPQMADIIAFVLAKHDFEPTVATTGEAGWRTLRSKDFDAVVLDVMLPDLSGLALCSRIRTVSDIPIIFLSALGSEDERIAGLEAGADDYLAKPFSPRELALRVKALLARTRTGGSHVITVGSLAIDTSQPVAIYHGDRLQLTSTSHAILRALAARPGEVVTVKELLNEVWQTSSGLGGKQMVKTAIYRLRQELGEAGDLVVTRRGAGYSLKK